MATLTITLPEKQFRALEEKSARLNITPEEFALLGVDDAISRPDEEFQKIMKEVLKEYAELYRRLAV